MKYPIKLFLYDRRGQFSKSPSYENEAQAEEAAKTWLFKGGLRAVLINRLNRTSREVTA
jgi:hypothetical protein